MTQPSGWQDTADTLADELIAVAFEAEPLAPTLLGLDGAHDRLADVSEQAQRRTRLRLADIAERAGLLRATELGAGDRVTAAVVRQQALADIDTIDAHAVEYTVTDLMIGPAAGLLTNLPMISLPDQGKAEAYLVRLAAIPGYLDASAQRHREGIEAGRLPVRHLAEAAEAHIGRYLAADTDPLARPQPPEGTDGFDQRRERVLAEVVRPAFARYRDVIGAEIAPRGRDQDQPGLCWLPGGESYYSALVRAHTTTRREPQELHDTGVALIEALGEEYVELGSRVFGTTDRAEIFHRLRTDPALRWHDADEVVTTAETAIARAMAAAPQWFGVIPEQQCEVRPVPEAEAPGAPPAYYMQPALDGSRPGIYYANTYQLGERFRYLAEGTAFHEAVPGHHFQLSIAQRLRGVPLLRKIGNFNAYTEGWGLYAERLAYDMGLYTDDVARLGMLANDSMRAGRLVVDTGLHALGWSRQQAVDYLTAHTPMAAVEISSEVDRYIAFAGQALSYMVGRLEIQRLRRAAERALGGTFDVRAFHDLVLGGGALPLAVLAEVVEEWVTSQAGESVVGVDHRAD
ncbi:MAG: DUF885 domain-containing protein [Sciscionella sp.]